MALNGPRFGVRVEAMSSKFGTDETPIACFGLTEPCGSAFEARYHHLFASGRDHGIVPVTIGVRL